jgi:hypothetical protein
MNANKKVKTSEINLDSIKLKLMHRESGEGWSQERADAVEREYRRFLYLMKKFPGEETSPTVDVDTFWHYHILDTMKYAEDCELVFGYFLHHYPYVGLRGSDDAAVRQRAGERMRELYEQTFGASEARDQESNEAAAAEEAGSAYCGATGQHAYCGATGTALTAPRAEASNAYCGAVGKVAYCGAGNKPAVRAAGNQSAYCGAVGAVMPIPARPSLARAA